MSQIETPGNPSPSSTTAMLRLSTSTSILKRPGRVSPLILALFRRACTQGDLRVCVATAIAGNALPRQYSAGRGVESRPGWRTSTTACIALWKTSRRAAVEVYSASASLTKKSLATEGMVREPLSTEAPAAVSASPRLPSRRRFASLTLETSGPGGLLFLLLSPCDARPGVNVGIGAPPRKSFGSRYLQAESLESRGGTHHRADREARNDRKVKADPFSARFYALRIK